LVAEGGRRGIHVLLDLVPNHTSNRHPWFIDARSSRQARHRDWYVWADPRPGGPPNNWLSAFGGPAWTLDPASGQCYLHNFLPQQPDLNWWNHEVRDAFDKILRFWFDRGIAGFRIDVAHMIVKDAELRDNPPATEADHPIVRAHGQRSVYNANRPELHQVLRRWREIADGCQPGRVLLGETWVLDLPTLASFYGSGADELHLAFNIPFIQAPFEAGALRAVVEDTEALLPPEAWPVWTASNHDVSRLASRWAGGDDARVRLAVLLLLTLRGTPVLYQGDEIGLLDTPLEYEQLRDPVGLRYWPANRGRDGARTPMPWTGAPGRGFSAPGVEPWLPVASAVASGEALASVADQRQDSGSILHLVRRLIALRQANPDLASGSYRGVAADGDGEVWMFRRGERTVVALNLSARAVTASLPAGEWELAFCTNPGRRLGRVASVDLSPWEGAVVTTT
jgi:alpha-glucosidase